MLFPGKLLVDDAAAALALSLSPEDLEWLISTEQLAPIIIRGRRLFDAAQLEELVRIYRTVQSREKTREQTHRE